MEIVDPIWSCDTCSTNIDLLVGYKIVSNSTPWWEWDILDPLGQVIRCKVCWLMGWLGCRLGYNGGEIINISSPSSCTAADDAHIHERTQLPHSLEMPSNRFTHLQCGNSPCFVYCTEDWFKDNIRSLPWFSYTFILVSPSLYTKSSIGLWCL